MNAAATTPQVPQQSTTRGPRGTSRRAARPALASVDQPAVGAWSSVLRLRLVPGVDGVLRASDLPLLRVARPGERWRVDLGRARCFDGDVAATVGRALARAGDVEVVAAAPQVAAAFRDAARDAARQLVELGVA